MSQPFSVSVESPDEDTAILAVVGDVDLFTAPEVGPRLAEALATGVRRVMVDLSGSSFVDSSGLATLIGAYGRVTDRGGRMALVSTGEEVAHILRVTGLDEVLTVVATREEALAALEAPGEPGAPGPPA